MMSAPRPIHTPPSAPLAAANAAPAGAQSAGNVVDGAQPAPEQDRAVAAGEPIPELIACYNNVQPTLPTPPRPLQPTRGGPQAIMTLLRRGAVPSHRAQASLTTPEMEARLKARGEALIAERDAS